MNILSIIIQNSPLLYFTQSIWRDEAFSILAAEKPLLEILPKLSFEPPVYYTLLHFWIKIFGNSEIAARSLSLLAFTIATIIVIEWSNKIYKKSFLSWFTPLIFFLNPMLLYYAFEIRTYGWYTLFSVISIIAYIEKRWTWLTFANILGFYTHTYFIFLPATQLFHYLFFKTELLKKPKKILKNSFIRSFLLFLAFISPWIIRIFQELPRLKESWYFPVDFQLVKSVLGNIYFGYEGTPWYGWKYTAWFSLFVLIISVSALLNNRKKRLSSYLFATVYLPLSFVIVISFIKPMFVNRYLIQCTVAMIFLLSYAIYLIKNKLIRVIIAVFLLSVTLFVNLWFPSKHPKTPIRNAIKTVNRLIDPDDRIYAISPLIFFEILYYADNRSQVFLYNPEKSKFPWYVGDAVFSEKYMIDNLPRYPKKAFLINEDGSYSIRYTLPLIK